MRTHLLSSRMTRRHRLRQWKPRGSALALNLWQFVRIRMITLNVYAKVALIAGLIAGAAWLNNRYVVRPAVERTDSAWQSRWDKRNEDDAKANLAALTKAREQEQNWQQRYDAIQAEADSEKAAAARRVANANAESDRLRTSVAAAIARLSGQSSAAASSSPAGRSTSNLLAQLFGELDQRATELATEADRARTAGLMCERAHDALTGK